MVRISAWDTEGLRLEPVGYIIIIINVVNMHFIINFKLLLFLLLKGPNGFESKRYPVCRFVARSC